MSGTGPTWRCSACDTYNAAAAGACEICGTARSAAAPAAGPVPKAAGPDIVALLPDLFNEDGTLKADRAAELAMAALPPVSGLGSMRGRERREAVAELRRRTEAAAMAAPEVTPGQEAFACGCLVVLVGALVYGIVMLVTHWGAVTGWAGHTVGLGKASPSPTVTASGPCPPNLLGTLSAAQSTGARLAAVYRRPDVPEEYVLCRTVAGRLYFVQIDGTSPGRAGDPEAAKAIDGGYETGSAAATIVFKSGTMTYEVGGVKKWTARYSPEVEP